ncbi:cell division protein FtsQ/DivIB [Acuticoccus sp. MNP-M23]|uniref:cell division protein FtsQ/DivIB n=1 Tax=Acuticoccus sp. MNP-M23 TaxID=3072793 RepID=UPI0028165AB2|nr:cell division protein FtsQ/DivIB [Acuticoccus sp. MNP-M23]WMS40857.1 cell division protein FtsQ/DivIB [Acuticoccus sp. MNP-M23]
MPALRSRAGRLASAAPGRLLAVAVLVGSCGAGLAYSEDPARMWDAVGRAGFNLREIKLKGQEHTSDSAIIAAVGLGPGVTLLGLDVEAARARLEGLPWVKTAAVRKSLPDRLLVEIEEREPFARWRWSGHEVVIDRHGNVLADDVPSRYRSLPLVAGAGANDVVESIREVLSADPALDERVAAAILVNERRWDLRLKNGATVRLPADQPEAALARLASIEERQPLLGVGEVVVDMRLADRTSVQLQAASATEDEGERPALQAEPVAQDALAAAIANATVSYDDPLARAIAEAMNQ